MCVFLDKFFVKKKENIIKHFHNLIQNYLIIHK